MRSPVPSSFFLIPIERSAKERGLKALPRFRITYKSKNKIEKFDFIASVFSREEVFAEICVREDILIGLGVAGKSFEEVAADAGISQMTYKVIPPFGFTRLD